MHSSEDDSPPYITSHHHNGPYNSSLASSASSSCASVWSDAASQSSEDSSSSSIPQDSHYATFARSHAPCLPSTAVWKNQLEAVVQAPTELRQHPRRTSIGSATRSGCPPSLVRQNDRKVSFVDSLVDSSAQIVETIWPLSSVVCRNEMGSKGVLPLRTFIQETLRRSRTSYSTLQVALYYLILIKPHVPKHDFTMEQPNESHSVRALQCGRRMFLSALILASKYLQDRNYSARAWSKISGLNTSEINQNEMAFLLAVNWKLHIPDAVFQRWTDIVLKYTPNQTLPPDSSPLLCVDQAENWKSIILRLQPGLEDVEVFTSTTDVPLAAVDSDAPRTFASMCIDRPSTSREATPTIKCHTVPVTLEPVYTSAFLSSKQLPALGLLPTPRLTPQSTSFNTPAVSAASYALNKMSSMSFAMAQASNACISQASEKWQPQYTSSPHPYVTQRRSSLADSVSSSSSPESMVSDTSSRSSRSSSISSSSSAGAPVTSKLDIQARCRYAKLCNDRNRVAVMNVPETYYDSALSSSPESYSGSTGKDLLDMCLDTPVTRQNFDMDCVSKDEEAARALQDLHNCPRSVNTSRRAGTKRSRPESMDFTLQENVRELLSSRNGVDTRWSDELVRPRYHKDHVSPTSRFGARPTLESRVSRKRVCCATEAISKIAQISHPAHNNIGPGMWEGIL